MKKLLLLVTQLVISFAAFPFKMPLPQPACLFFLILFFCSNTDLSAQAFNEDFDDITTLAGKGWVMQNASDPVDETSTDWFQGGSYVFPAYNGAEEAYIAANYNNVLNYGTISNWLLTPVRTIKNGDILTFYTRKDDIDLYADRLEIRLSTNGTSTNVGSGSTVGDFSTLLLSINPTLELDIYPTSWTLYTVTVSGLSTPVSGRFAFRYFVTDGGTSGTSSDYIGIDQVRYTPITPVITPAAGIVYVKKGAIGNGSSWVNATGELADALVAAKTNTSITQIWVAAGVYKPLYSPADNNFGQADARNNAFLLVNNVKVYGGFAGTETLLTDRDLTLTANASTLSGNLGDLTVNTDNAYHVVISTGNVGTAELNGFTIIDGNANGTNELTVNGASVDRDFGGGIHVYSYSSPILANLTVSGNNTSRSGGGICINFNSNPILTRIIASGNTATDYGGGIFINYISRPILSHITITGNTAYHGGGMFISQSSPTITNLIVTGNTASRDGGGMYNDNRSFPILTHVSIRENRASRNGGGICNYNFSAPTLTHVAIAGNTATNGAGIHNFSSSTTSTLTNATITGNKATENGGAMYNENASSPTLTNVTISGNTAVTNGGGFYNNSSSPKIRNSIIYGNNTGIFNYGSVPVITYSLVQDLPADATNGNIAGTTNPLFVTAPLFGNAPFTTGDYSLQNNSPVINKGNNAYFDALQVPDLSAISTDVAGNPRLYGTTIDMGAYESQQDPLPVTLISFIASLQGENKVLLEWRTASELNNKGFEIETLRLDNTYQKIGFVQGNGTTNTAQRYQTVLSELPIGIHYFRLKIIDMDDSFAYSRLRSVNVTNGLELTTKIYPNPVTGQYVYIQIPNGATNKANVKITNMLGRVISSADYTNFTGLLKIQMPAATGSYLIEVTVDDAFPVVKKVIKL